MKWATKIFAFFRETFRSLESESAVLQIDETFPSSLNQCEPSIMIKNDFQGLS